MIYSIDKLPELDIKCNTGCKIFLYGDLGAGKTTFIKSIIQKLLGEKTIVTSPTYIHYKKYGEKIFHFDLYRLGEYEEFMNIGGEEILDNKDNICLIEWPELIENIYKPDIIIRLNKVEGNDEVRDIEIKYN